MDTSNKWEPSGKIVLYSFVYLYSAQYLLVQQASKRYLTDPNYTSKVTDIPLTKTWRLKDEHLL